MNSIEFVKHPLKKNDTLETVAEELSISSEYLQLIHNLNVEVCDKLKSSRGNFPSHLAEIYIEKTTQNAFLEKLNEKRPKNKEILEYIPQKDKKSYTVFYDFSDGEEQNTISFETSIVAVENNSNIKGYLVEIDRTSSIVVDNELPQLVIDEFTIETAKVIYPLQLIISPGGKCIGIKNYEEIIKRWEIVKQKVHDIFESQWVEHYLSYTDITLQSKETLFASLKKDWFLSTFFATIYTNYYSNYKINNTLKFPTLPDFEDFEYSIVQKMNNYSDDTNQLTISQEGTIENQKHESDAPLTPINGHFKAEYLLDPKDNSIKKITVNCSLDFTTPIKLAIAINQKQ